MKLFKVTLHGTHRVRNRKCVVIARVMAETAEEAKILFYGEADLDGVEQESVEVEELFTGSVLHLAARWL